MNRLIANSTFLALGSIGAQALSAIVFWMIARRSTPSEFGSIAAALGVAMLVASVLDFGVNSHTTRLLAAHPNRYDKFQKTLNAKLTVGALSLVAWVIICLLLSIYGITRYSVILLGPFILGSMLVGTALVPFRSSENMAIVSVSQVIQSSAGLLGTLTALFLGFAPEYSLPIGLTFGAFSTSIFAIRRLPIKATLLRRPSLADCRGLWGASIGFGISGLATQLQRADVAIVNGICGAGAAGVFAAPARITNLLGVLPTSFAAAVFPHVAGKLGDSCGRANWARGTVILLSLVAVQLVLIYVLADYLVRLTLGESYSESANVLKVYLLGMLFASANSPLAALLQAEGHEKYVAKAVGGAAVAGLIIVAVGAMANGAIGAAFGFVVLQILVTSALTVRVLRSQRDFKAPVSLAFRRGHSSANS